MWLWNGASCASCRPDCRAGLAASTWSRVEPPAAPGTEHLPPLALREDLGFPERLYFRLAVDTGGRKLIARRGVVGPEKNVPKRQDEREVPVVMLRQAAVMDAVNLGAAEKQACPAHLQPGVHMPETQQRSKERGNDAAEQTEFLRIERVGLEEERQREGHEHYL